MDFEIPVSIKELKNILYAIESVNIEELQPYAQLFNGEGKKDQPPGGKAWIAWFLDYAEKKLKEPEEQKNV